MLRPPEPAETGQRSTHFTERLELTDETGQCGWRTRFPVEASPVVDGWGGFSVGAQSDRSTSAWDLILRDPSGEVVDPGSTLEGADPSEVEDGILGFRISSEEGGLWEAEILTDKESCDDVEVTTGVFGVSFEGTSRGLFTHVTSLDLHVGKRVGVVTYLFEADTTPEDDEEGDVVPPPLFTGEIERATMTVTFPNGNTEEVSMLTIDGNVWSSSVLAVEEGTYAFAVDVEWKTGGVLMRRTDVVQAPVIQAKVELNKRRKLEAHVDAAKDSLRFKFPIRTINVPTPEAEEHAETDEYFLSTEIWAVLAGVDDPFPMAWAGNLVTPEILTDPDGDGSTSLLSLSVRLDQQWISNIKSLPGAERISGFTFRNIILRDAETRTPLDRLEELTYLLTTEIFAPDFAVTELVAGLPAIFIPSENLPRMLEGAPPTFLETLRQEIEEAAFPELSGSLLLVHGWCGSAQTWDRSQFAGNEGSSGRRVFIYFDEHTKNKTCDSGGFPCQVGKQISTSRFADRLAAYLVDEQQPPGGRVAGIVAHSQGGLASLLMLNDTHTSMTSLGSLFDRSDIRLVQTIGAPWRGTPLAFGLLSPGRIFGRKGPWNCKTENAFMQLAPVAVHNILSCVPKSARQEIHYKRTQHKRLKANPKTWFGRWCGWLRSKVLLPGADDGTVQLSRSKLDGGNDLGTAERLCHYKMKYPDQKRSEDLVLELCRESFLGLSSICR